MLIYSFKVKKEPVFQNGYIVGYNEIETHTSIVHNETEIHGLLDPEVCEDVRLIGEITERELKEAYNRLINCPVS